MMSSGVVPETIVSPQLCASQLRVYAKSLMKPCPVGTSDELAGAVVLPNSWLLVAI